MLMKMTCPHEILGENQIPQSFIKKKILELLFGEQIKENAYQSVPERTRGVPGDGIVKYVMMKVIWYSRVHFPLKMCAASRK